MNKDQAIEYLLCALVNCDNIQHLGVVGVQIVRMQIQSALDELTKPEGEDSEPGPVPE